MLVNCECCGKELERANWQIKDNKSGKFYCSMQCRQPKPIHRCDECGKEFSKSRLTKRTKHTFCSRKCFGKYSGRARIESGTWNKHLKGKRLSPNTEFKKGVLLPHAKPVGSLSVRQHHDDSPRNWIKLAQPSLWIPLAHYVWISANGEIPRGCIVHHKDRNTLNDDLGNLELLTRAQHINEHRDEYEVALRLTRLAKAALKEFGQLPQGLLASQSSSPTAESRPEPT